MQAGCDAVWLIPVLGRQELVDPWDSLKSQADLGSSRPRLSLIHTTDGRHLRNDTQGCLLASEHTHRQVHTHTYSHASAHTQKADM